MGRQSRYELDSLLCTMANKQRTCDMWTSTVAFLAASMFASAGGSPGGPPPPHQGPPSQQSPYHGPPSSGQSPVIDGYSGHPAHHPERMQHTPVRHHSPINLASSSNSNSHRRHSSPLDSAQQVKAMPRELPQTPPHSRPESASTLSATQGSPSLTPGQGNGPRDTSNPFMPESLRMLLDQSQQMSANRGGLVSYSI